MNFNIFDKKTKQVVGTIEAASEYDAAITILRSTRLPAEVKGDFSREPGRNPFFGSSVYLSETTEFPSKRWQRAHTMHFDVFQFNINPKAKHVEFTGKLQRVEMLRQACGDWYHERYEYRLDCTLKTSDGLTVYFKSPSIKQCVALGGGYAVVTYNNENNGWVYVEGKERVAMPGKPAGGIVKPVVNEGDEITISGRLVADKKVSKRGNVYSSVNYVKLVSKTKRFLRENDETLCNILSSRNENRRP